MSAKSAQDLAVVILAAGKGTRMKSSLPKVMHPVAGRPMLWHLLNATRSLNPSRTVVITGYGADLVESYTTENFPGTEFARQEEQLGTGHAIMQTESLLKNFPGTVLIVYADILLSTRPDVLPILMEQNASNTSGLTMLTANVSNPASFGRVFMHKGVLISIEEKDCTAEQKKITTVNPCIFALPASLLFKLLSQLTNDNAQKEYYLTDIIALAHKNGAPVIASEVPAERSEVGMNSRQEVAEMETLWQTRRRKDMMTSGVSLLDPSTVYFAPDTVVAPDTTIHQNVIFGPGVTIESGVSILPFCHIEGATIKSGATVGPFARIRPTSVVGNNAKVGNFVELKNTTLGTKASAGHLTYLGDATVGEHTNIGAGTVTANYNHKTHAKAKTVIGAHASTGSNTVIVAPATLGDKAYTGANTVVRGNVEPGTLIVSKPEQIEKKNYNK